MNEIIMQKLAYIECNHIPNGLNEKRLFISTVIMLNRIVAVLKENKNSEHYFHIQLIVIIHQTRIPTSFILYVFGTSSINTCVSSSLVLPLCS